jgi:hypothetical protein
VAWADPEGLGVIDTVGEWLNWPVDVVSDWIMDVFWPQGETTCSSHNAEFADLLAEVRGGLPGWDAREATKHSIVVPFVGTGMVAADVLFRPPSFSPRWRKNRGRWRSPTGEEWKAHPAGAKNPHGAHWDVIIPKGKMKGKWRHYPDGRWEPK